MTDWLPDLHVIVHEKDGAWFVSVFDTQRLIDELKQRTKEREEARDAARWIYIHRPQRNTPIMKEVYERWPWLGDIM